MGIVLLFLQLFTSLKLFQNKWLKTPKSPWLRYQRKCAGKIGAGSQRVECKQQRVAQEAYPASIPGPLSSRG